MIAKLLQKDPAMRPTIHQILRMPQIASRIQNFLDGASFKDEFAHTILHNQDVFEEFRSAQIKMKEQASKDKQEADLAKKMQEMQIN